MKRAKKMYSHIKVHKSWELLKKTDVSNKVGYKGNFSYDTGVFYAPYKPVLLSGSYA